MEQTASRETELLQNMQKTTFADVFNSSTFGMALTLAWIFIVQFSSVIHFSTRFDLEHFNSVSGYSSLAMIVVFAVGIAFPRVINALFAHRAFPPLLAAALMACMIILYIIDLDYFEQPWCSMTSFAVGLGAGLLYLWIGDLFKGMAFRRMVMCAASGFVMAALIFAIVVALPRVIALGATLGIVALIGFVLNKTQGRVSPCAGEGEKPGFAAIRECDVEFVRLFIAIGIVSLLESTVRALFLNAGPIISEGSYPWLFLVATIAALGLLVIPLLSFKMANFAPVYKVVIFPLVVIFLLLPLLPWGTPASSIMALLAYCILAMFVWIALCHIANVRDMSPLIVFGFGWGMQIGGMLAGSLIGALLLTFGSLDAWGLSLIAFICTCGVFAVYLLIMPESLMGSYLGDAGRSSSRPFYERCQAVADRCGLSEREFDVMVLLAKGRSNPRIQKELGISPGTTNSHLSSLYRKLGVHDKQEMIDLIEREEI